MNHPTHKHYLYYHTTVLMDFLLQDLVNLIHEPPFSTISANILYILTEKIAMLRHITVHAKILIDPFSPQNQDVLQKQ